MFETWYIMEDGSSGDPREIAPDKSGKLAHSDGRKVAYAPHGPRSRSVDAEAERAKAAAADKKSKEAKDKKPADDDGKAAGAKVVGKDMKPEAKQPGYTTRESKAD